MKQLLSIAKYSLFAVIATFTLWCTNQVQAAQYYGLDVSGQKSGYANGPQVTATSLTVKIVSGGLELLLIVFLILAIYAGIRWMTARGDEEAVTKAKDTLSAAVIGLIIVIAAYAITSFIFGRLSGIQSTGSPTIQENNGQGETIGGEPGTINNVDLAKCRAFNSNPTKCGQQGCVPIQVTGQWTCNPQAYVSQCQANKDACKKNPTNCETDFNICLKF